MTGTREMTKEALELALEALEKLWNIIDDIDTYGDMAKADEKLYRALVERRQRTRFEETGISTDGYELNGGVINAIKEALAQPEQEPVAWMSEDERKAFERFNETCEDGEGYDVPKTMMKRLAEIGVIHHTSRGIYGITKFGRLLVGNTTPPQRTWIGLSDEERQEIALEVPIDSVLITEAKLKEKNTRGQE